MSTTHEARYLHPAAAAASAAQRYSAPTAGYGPGYYGNMAAAAAAQRQAMMWGQHRGHHDPRHQHPQHQPHQWGSPYRQPYYHPADPYRQPPHHQVPTTTGVYAPYRPPGHDAPGAHRLPHMHSTGLMQRQFLEERNLDAREHGLCLEQQKLQHQLHRLSLEMAEIAKHRQRLEARHRYMRTQSMTEPRFAVRPHTVY